MKTKENNIKKTELEEKKEIESSNPVLMYDAMGTIITLCDPIEPLKSKEESALYSLSSLKSYSLANETILEIIIHELQLDEIASTVKNNLTNKGLPPKAIFFALVDIMTEEYCKKIGDVNQELRIEVLSKIHKLANPRIFDEISEYSQKAYNESISQLILTQDNAIMKEVYNQMLKDYDLDVIVVPDPKFENLRKDNPELYIKVAKYLNREPNNIGFYDDTEGNLNAANKAKILTQLATGIKNNVPEIIKVEASMLVEQLFEEQGRKKVLK